MSIELKKTILAQQETIRCQQIVLDQIAQMLGVETGDVEGIGREIERLKEDEDRERIKLAGVQEFREHMLEQHKRFGKDIATVMMDGIVLGYLAERGIRLGMKEALAGGEVV